MHKLDAKKRFCVFCKEEIALLYYINTHYANRFECSKCQYIVNFKVTEDNYNIAKIKYSRFGLYKFTSKCKRIVLELDQYNMYYTVFTGTEDNSNLSIICTKDNVNWISINEIKAQIEKQVKLLSIS